MNSNANERRSRRRLALAVFMGLLVAVSPFLYVFGGFVAMGTDMCGEGVDYPICSPRVANLVILLPLLGLLAGLLVGIVGGVVAIRHDHPPDLWIVLAWLLPVVALAVSIGIADAR